MTWRYSVKSSAEWACKIILTLRAEELGRTDILIGNAGRRMEVLPLLRSNRLDSTANLR